MTQRERHSLTRLVETHYEDIKRYIQRRTGSSSTASDIVQETWLRAARHSNKVPDNPLGYLYRIASNLLLDKLRQDKAHGRHFADIAPPEDTECPRVAPDEAARISEELELLADAVRDLPDKCREVFLLYRGDGLTMREIAAQLHISESTVEKHLAKAMQHCRKRLERAP